MCIDRRLCKNGYFVENNLNCKSKSKNNKYYIIFSKSQECSGECVYCELESSKCLSCKAGKYSFNYECRTFCPEGYYANLFDGTC